MAIIAKIISVEYLFLIVELQGITLAFLDLQAHTSIVYPSV